MIKVNKISLDSYNKLSSLGYFVAFTQSTSKPSSYGKYTYHKTVNPIKYKKEMKYFGYSCLICKKATCNLKCFHEIKE